MSKKRASDDSNNDDLQQEDNAKCAKLTLFGDTTLQDLPIELLEGLLVKAVVMEVKGMKLAKSVWKEKADLVISRLTTDCWQWSSIFTTDFFRNEVHKTLDGTAQETFRLEILQQSPIKLEVIQVTTVKDEIFMLCKQNGKYSIAVYDRNNTADVKDVIELPGISPVEIAGCSASNCVYVLNKESDCHSVVRITKQEEHQFNISLRQPISSISVSSNGNLVILSRELLVTDIISGQRKPIPTVIKIYNLNGSLQHEIILLPDILCIRHIFNAIQKSNGNLLLVSMNRSKVLLTEIDLTGRILRQCQSALLDDFDLRLVDIQGRILLSDKRCRMELFDSDLNPLDFTGEKQYEGQFASPSKLHYNSERNEIVSVCELLSTKTQVLSIFRFTEE